MDVIYKKLRNPIRLQSLYPKIGLAWILLLLTFGSTSAQLSGYVFRDFNGDGVRQLSFPTEPGISGVVVSAYVAGQPAPQITYTDSLGFYSFLMPAGIKVRVEFSGFPFESYVSVEGSNNASSVQFVTTPQSNADLALVDPLAYCKNVQPDLVVPTYVTGNALLPGSNSDPLASLVFFPYSASGQGTDPISLATTGATGSIWGGAYHRQDKKLFYSAFLKRHSSLGPLGLGGIYLTDLSGSSPSTSSYLDLSRFMPMSSAADSLLLKNRNLPLDYLIPSVDSSAFRLMGKVGLGGMALSPDEKSLWVVNLYLKKLVKINIGAPIRPGSQITGADLSTFSIPDPGCVSGQARPWALEYHQGSMYVGVTCDAAQTDGSRGNLRAYVYRFDLQTMSFITTPVISEALDYRKGWVHAGVPQSEYWEPWTDKWSDMTTSFLTLSNLTPIHRVSRPQPIFSDIEFDTDGSILLGLMDRTGHQTAHYQASIPAGLNLYCGYVGGDILRAQAYADGTFKLEKNGISGLRAGSGVGNNEGPGGGEFYGADLYKDPISGEVIQQETFMGSMVVVPGNDEVIVSVIEPFTAWTGGVAWFSNEDGSRSKAFELYNANDPSNIHFVGNANGTGSIRALCEAAPLQIGNRLWVDANQNGIQDPDELPLANVYVSLYTANGSLLGTTQTNASGNYSFGSGVILPNTKYYIALGTNGSTPQFNKQEGVLSVNGAAYKLTVANTGQGNNTDLNDSDALVADGLLPALNGFPVIQVVTGAAGQNNDHLDAGFITCWTDAGADTTVCEGTTSVQLTAAGIGQIWGAVAGNPSAAGISPTGLVTGLGGVGTYKFVLIQEGNCRDTVQIIVSAKPAVSATITRTTCSNFISDNNGQITLTGFTAQQTFDYSLGATFSTPVFGSPQPIPLDGSILSNLPNPTDPAQQYTVRIYNGTVCTQDIVLTLLRRDCACEDLEAVCLPISARILKKP